MKFRTDVSTDAGACIFAALCLLLLPLRWNIGVLVAAAVHEASHLIVILAMGIPVTYFKVGIRGARIGTGPMTHGQELLSAAAGPLGSFCLLFCIHLYPEAAFCGLVQGFFNLLPLYPFDGGRILRCLTARCSPQLQRSIEMRFFVLVMILLLAGAAVLTVLFPRWWIWIGGGAFLVLWRAFRKIPCKAVPADVQ